MKRLASLIIITAVTAVLCCGAGAYSESIPVISVPETRCWKLELSLPDEVSGGTTFSAVFSFGKAYKAFPENALVSVSGTLIWDADLFEPELSPISGNGFSVGFSGGSAGSALFTLDFASPPSAEALLGMSFDIPFTALAAEDTDGVIQITRVYIYTDLTSGVSSDGSVYDGIGGIGYTRYIFAAASEDPSEPSEEQSVYIPPEPSQPPYTSEYSLPSYSAPEASEEPHEEIDPQAYVAEFLTANTLGESDGVITGMRPKTLSDSLTNDFNMISVITGRPLTQKSFFVATGDMLLLFDESGCVAGEYISVILGDIYCDGTVAPSDYILLRLRLLRLRELTDIQKKAADINGDGRLNASDYIALRLHILGLRDIYSD